jgi:hypothetical protein
MMDENTGKPEFLYGDPKFLKERPMKHEMDTTNTDAMYWAKEMAKVGRTLDNPMDEEWLVGWFANYWTAVYAPLHKRLLRQEGRIEELEAKLISPPEKQEHPDLSVEEGIAYLTTAELMLEDRLAWGVPYNQPLIKWEGEWIHLCRTDLKDDVATGVCQTKSVEEWREYYLAHIRYGVRITPLGLGGWVRYNDGTEGKLEGSTEPRFACIDGWSDG